MVALLKFFTDSGSRLSAREESPWVGGSNLTAAVEEQNKGPMYRFSRWIAARWLLLGNRVGMF